MKNITYGNRVIDFNLTLALMDNSISNQLNCRLSPLATDQNFFDAYVIKHREKFGEEFLINETKERQAERIKKITELLKIAEQRREECDQLWLKAMINNELDRCAYFDNEIQIHSKEIAECTEMLRYALFTTDEEQLK